MRLKENGYIGRPAKCEPTFIVLAPPSLAVNIFPIWATSPGVVDRERVATARCRSELFLTTGSPWELDGEGVIRGAGGEMVC